MEKDSLSRIDETLSFIEEKISAQMKSFRESKDNYKWVHLKLTILVASLSAVTTVFIGIDKSIECEYLFILPLVSSALVGITVAYDGIIKPKEMWIQKTNTFIELINLKGKIEYARTSKVTISQDEADQYYEKFEQILLNEHKAWTQVRSPHQSK